MCERSHKFSNLFNLRKINTDWNGRNRFWCRERKKKATSIETISNKNANASLWQKHQIKWFYWYFSYARRSHCLYDDDFFLQRNFHALHTINCVCECRFRPLFRCNINISCCVWVSCILSLIVVLSCSFASSNFVTETANERFATATKIFHWSFLSADIINHYKNGTQ